MVETRATKARDAAENEYQDEQERRTTDETQTTGEPEAAEDEEQHQDEQDLVNPTRLCNRPKNPKTQEEFEQWLIDTKAALLLWLQQSRSRAQDEQTRIKVEQFARESKENWKTYEQQIDVQTGNMYRETQPKVLQDAMASEALRREELHRDLRTQERFWEYRAAQSAWEDFLYYQNVWNRKNESSQRFKETPDERKPVTAIGKAPTGEKIPVCGTEGPSSITRRSDWRESKFWKHLESWRVNMLKLYKQFGLGYRKQIPSIVGPNDAHRYSQPPRGTTPQDSHSYKRRHRHLEERFPRQKRRVDFDELEPEEMYRKKEARLKDNQHSRRGEMTPIAWKLDEDSYRRTRFEKEEAAADGFCRNPITQQYLPDGHETHHGSLETSFDWPTSFESVKWGNNMSRTAMKHVYDYEENSSDSEDNDLDRYKRDDNGNKIRKLAPRRYRTRVVTEDGQDFAHDMNSDGTVAGRDRTGRWRGRYIGGPVEREELDRDENNKRIPLPGRYAFHNEFTTRIVRDQKQRNFRRERHQSENVEYQLSDDEANDCINSNKNWTRSGNANPEQVGRYLPPDHGGALDQGDSDSDDGEESDSDGDIFKASYEEASGTESTRGRARRLLADMQANIGTYPRYNLDQAIAEVDDGMESDEIREGYMFEYVLWSTRDKEETEDEESSADP